MKNSENWCYFYMYKMSLICSLLANVVEIKVAKATGVADEALGNVRTVKAFAMEERELQ